VTFLTGGRAIGTQSLDSGTATLNYAALLPGTYDITAIYNGSANVAGSTSTAFSQVVNLTTTTTTLSGPASATYGQSITLSATVESTNGVSPTGTVSFKNGSALLGNARLNPAAAGMASASIVTSILPVGMDLITADYTGSKLMKGNTSPATTISVSQATSTTSLTSSMNPSTGGQTVKFIAAVSPLNGGVPAGTVTFLSGGTAVGTVILSPGTASLNYSELTIGTHSITAAYNGSANVSGSTSAAVSQLVNLDTTTTVLTTSPNPSTSGQSVTLTATVAPGNGVAATGTVSFYSGSTLLGNVSLSGGVAALDHAFTTGTYSLTAKYTGSNYKSASTSSTVNQVVNP
jgi:hypothetical protein